MKIGLTLGLGAQGGAWSPASDPLIGGYWDARDLSASPVSSWDSRGAGPTIANSGASGQPSLTSGAVVFDGVNDALLGSCRTLGVGTLPDGASESVSGVGFTCTGGPVLLPNGNYAIMNFGLPISGSGDTQAPSIVELEKTGYGAFSFVADHTLASLYPAVTFASCQGLVLDSVEQLWFTDGGNKKLRCVDPSTWTAVTANDITVSFIPNGLAYRAATDRFYVIADWDNDTHPNTFEVWNRVAKTLVSTTTTFQTTLNNKDHLFIWTLNGSDYLCLGYAANGFSYRMAVCDLTGATVYATYIFTGSLSGEGFTLFQVGSKWHALVCNDKYYHGQGATNVVYEYEIVPFRDAACIDLFGKVKLASTTGTDAILVIGEPLGSPGIGLYAVSTSALRVFANTDTGTGSRVQLDATSLTLTDYFTFYARIDSANDAATIWVNGTQIATTSAAALASALDGGSQVNMGQSLEGDKRYAALSVKALGFYRGAGDRARTEAYLTALA